MIEALVGKLGVPVLVTVLAEALGKMDNPLAKGAARALGDLEGAIADGTISQADLAEAHRHAEKMAELKLKEYEFSVREINKSARMELESEDKYVRRMRPTFGYLMAFTWTIQMVGIAYVMVFETEKSGVVMSGMSALSGIWAVALSVLGIYVYKRSEDKKTTGLDTIFWNQRNGKS